MMGQLAGQLAGLQLISFSYNYFAIINTFKMVWNVGFLGWKDDGTAGRTAGRTTADKFFIQLLCHNKYLENGLRFRISRMKRLWDSWQDSWQDCTRYSFSYNYFAIINTLKMVWNLGFLEWKDDGTAGRTAGRTACERPFCTFVMPQ